MGITYKIEENICVFTFDYSIEFPSKNSFREELQKTWEEASSENPGIKALIFNLDNVPPVTSSPLGNFVEFYKTVKRDNQIPVLFCNANTFTKDVFSLAQLDKIFSFFDTEEEAIQDCLKNGGIGGENNGNISYIREALKAPFFQAFDAFSPTHYTVTKQPFIS